MIERSQRSLTENNPARDLTAYIKGGPARLGVFCEAGGRHPGMLEFQEHR